MKKNLMFAYWLSSYFSISSLAKLKKKIFSKGTSHLIGLFECQFESTSSKDENCKENCTWNCMLCRMFV